MKKIYWLAAIAATCILVAAIIVSCGRSSSATTTASDMNRANSLQAFDSGKQTFRFDTFGDEAFWGDTLKLHQTIEGSKFAGGVGAGVSPETALAVGLKVDVDALPDDLVTKLKNGTLDLKDPANTLALIKLNAVLGITGFFNSDGSMKSIGIQCAFCHSTVDDSLSPGIGHRLDGWANRDLNVGAIVNLSPDLSVVVALLKPAIPTIDEATVRAVLNGWGPGKFDAQLFLDGKAAKPGGALGSSATLIPPAFGLAGVNLHTSTGWGSVTYWNAFVANLEMHGQGTFFDPRLRDSKNADGTPQFPVAIANKFYDVRPLNNGPDRITPKLATLQFYQLAIQAPIPPADKFDQTAAGRGSILFNGKAKCAICHVLPLFTEPGWNMHTPAEIGLTAPNDDFQANRSPDKRYRTTPLKGLWTHTKGGFYHDGRFPALLDVVNHYDTFMALGLTAPEKSDLVEYLKSL
jgi:hypothetical protein